MSLDFWSHTDYTYVCLIDTERVALLERAISAVVRAGQTVVDVGAGSGILGLLAARAGASKVYAVEIDPLLASTLRETVRANGLQSIVEVVEGDATQVDLPKDVDVVIAELVETWLLDEAQVPVMNALRECGVIGANTQVIPERYDAFLELVDWDNHFYGFEIAHPKHEWPNYGREPGWWKSEVRPVSARIPVFSADFQAPVSPLLEELIDIGRLGGLPNAVRLSGDILLARGVTLSATPSLNGPKVVMLSADLAASFGPEGSVPDRLRVSAELGGGLGSFALSDVLGS